MSKRIFFENYSFNDEGGYDVVIKLYYVGVYIIDGIGNLLSPEFFMHFFLSSLYKGSKTEIKNHYRGHKLSMWLNLIPQLHASGDPELPMRHHHFAEESAQFYDGM